ncbi:hypothetical protein P8883_07490 [Bacillus atrophaeus]|uniref:hypothetical protein n=1 Tax=Bacillus atrophaeus TaxID=1452 RepID=UPI002DB62675|nr:hypothetical protein [Bacillus atrophaeus]MEC0804120.1 hypothetical protein [Bacillus atrophaeus]
MKKLLFVLLLGLSGCGGVDAGSQSTDKQVLPGEEKNVFVFSLDQFIDEYNNNIDNIHDDVEKRPSHLITDDEFYKTAKNNYVNVFVKEVDNDSEKSYKIAGLYDKDKILTGMNISVDLIPDKDKIFKPSKKGTRAVYSMLKSLGFEEDTLQKALEKADPVYSVSNDICVMKFILQPSEHKYIIEFKPKVRS